MFRGRWQLRSVVLHREARIRQVFDDLASVVVVDPEHGAEPLPACSVDIVPDMSARAAKHTAISASRAAFRNSSPSDNCSSGSRSVFSWTKSSVVVIGSPVSTGTASSREARAASRGC
jgi:hypothetical protein